MSFTDETALNIDSDRGGIIGHFSPALLVGILLRFLRRVLRFFSFLVVRQTPTIQSVNQRLIA